MGYEKRRGASYFYGARWVDGRVEKDYFGRGPEAEVAAHLAEDHAARRARNAATVVAERTRLTAAREASWDLAVECRARLAEVMAAIGYHRQNSGPWRRRRDWARTARRTLSESPVTLRLVPLVDEPTAIAAVAAWAAVYARGESALGDAMVKAAAEVRDALATIVDPPVLRLVAAWASVAWLEFQWAEVAEAELASDKNPRRLETARRTAVAARSRLARVLAELGTVRRLIEADTEVALSPCERLLRDQAARAV